MPPVVFTYKKASGSSMMTLFQKEDVTSEDYRLLQEKIGAFNMLYLSRSHHIHPVGHKESKDEFAARTNFSMDDFVLIAAEFNNEGVTGYASALLVSKKNKELAFVIELTGFQVIDSVFGAWAVEDDDGDAVSMTECLDYFGLQEKPKPVAAPKKEREEPVVPSFVPNKKRGIPTLDEPRYQPHEEEEDTPVHVEFERTAFQPNPSKKPRKINLDFEKKPVIKKEEPVEEKKETAPNLSPVPEPIFSPSSSKRPPNLNQSSRVWNARPILRFRPDQKRPGARILVYAPNDPYVMGIYATVVKPLESLRALDVYDQCSFAPSLPDEESTWRKYLRDFHLDQWRVLALNLDPYNQVLSYLLGNIEVNGLALMVTKGGLVTGVSFQGIDCSYPHYRYDDMMWLFEKPKAKPTVTPVVSPKKAEVERVPEPLDEEEAEEKPLRAMRRVFVTKSFMKDQRRFEDKYHAVARDDFEDTIRYLLSLDDDELEKYLRAKDSKPILVRNGVTIYKFRFGTAKDYEASRLFYCRGFDLGRKMESADYVLLGMSGQDEHEEQTEVSLLLSRLFDSKNDLVLYQKLLPIKKEAKLDDIAYMSSKQFRYLDEARSTMPMAFLGSAGTGKTLLSLRHYLSLLEEGKKVLYLTYQRALCEEVRQRLCELGGTDVEAMTYRELCASIFGEDASNRMRTKKRFRSWFYSYRNKTGTIQGKLKEIGPTAEDQFMICYVFYRGIIDGSRRRYNVRKGNILSRQEFLDEVKNEEGFSMAAKQAVYDVAVAYENHLERHKGTTDNKLAYRILSMGKKAQRYDAIVIDEFQDLSEIQFMAVVSLLKVSYPLPLFIYGDENQAINPTIFGFSDANNILYDMFGNKVRFTRQDLVDSYRSGPNLVHYINEVNRVKRSAIGARSQEEEVEISLREDEEDLFATLVEGRENLAELIRICADSDKEVKFIFPTVLRKDQAAGEFKSIAPSFVATSFLSVEEAKGRQWDSVVLVDFFSSSNALFDAMIGEEKAGRHSTIHRMLFNRFYVALTRAENRIVVFETDVTNSVREKLLSGLTPLPDLSSLATYFQGIADEASWAEFGEKLFQGRNYADAVKAFAHVHTEHGKEMMELSHLYYLASEDELSFEQSRDLYLGQLDFDKLASLYEEQGLSDHRRFLLAENEPRASDYQLEIYRSLAPTLTALERKTFFALLCRRFCKRINSKINQIHRNRKGE